MQTKDGRGTGDANEEWLTLAEAARWVVARTMEPLPDTWQRVIATVRAGKSRPGSALPPAKSSSVIAYPEEHLIAASNAMAELRRALSKGDIPAFGIRRSEASATPVPPAVFSQRKLNHRETSELYEPYDVIVVKRAEVLARWTEVLPQPRRGRKLEYPYENSILFLREAFEAGGGQLAFNSKNAFTRAQLARNAVKIMAAALGGSRHAPSVPTMLAHVKRWLEEDNK